MSAVPETWNATTVATAERGNASYELVRCGASPFREEGELWVVRHLLRAGRTETTKRLAEPADAALFE